MADGGRRAGSPEPDAAPADRGRCRRAALVLSGGVALGAYEAGAYSALEEAGAPLPDGLAGASIGAVNAAIVAGNPPGLRVERVRRFWEAVAVDPMPATSFRFGPPPGAGTWRPAHDRAGAPQG